MVAKLFSWRDKFSSVRLLCSARLLWRVVTDLGVLRGSLAVGVLEQLSPEMTVFTGELTA